MTVLAALCSLAAIVWLIPLIRSGRVTTLATTVLLTGTILGPAFYAFDGPIQISIDRVLWGGVFLVLAYRWRMGQLSIGKPNRVDWVVLGLAGWFLASAFRGEPVPNNFTPPPARWLFYIAMPVGMYAFARCIDPRPRDIRWFLGALLCLGGYLAVTAICEVKGVHWLVYPTHIVDGDSWEFYGRGRGPLMNPAGNGILMSIAVAVAGLGFLRSGRRGKFLFGLLAVVLAVGIYATMTRSAWLGAGAAIAVIAIVQAPRWVRVLGLASVILFGGAMAMGLKDQLLRLKRDKHLSAADAEESIQLRPLLAIVGWEMFKDRPIAGHGFGHYFASSGPYHDIRGYDLPLENARPYAQHNIFLSVLVDAGLVGLVLFVSLLVTLAGIGWQLARNRGSPPEARSVGILMLSTLCAYSCNGMFQDVLIIPMVHMFLFFIAGLTVTVYASGIRCADSRQANPRGAVVTRRELTVTNA